MAFRVARRGAYVDHALTVRLAPFAQRCEQPWRQRNNMRAPGRILALHPLAGDVPVARIHIPPLAMAIANSNINAVEVEFFPSGADDFGDPQGRKREQLVGALNALAGVCCPRVPQDRPDASEARYRRKVLALGLAPAPRRGQRVAGYRASLDRIVEDRVEAPPDLF